MDWCVDTRVRGAADLVESEVAAHLARHAMESGVVELARAAVRRGLADPAPGPLWVTLDWSGHQCLMRVGALPPGALPGHEIGPGVHRAYKEARRLADGRGADGYVEQVIELGVARAPEHDIDLPPAPPDTFPELDSAHVMGLISGQITAGHTLEEAASKAGATVAAMSGTETATSDPDDAVARLIEAERRLGADFELVESGPRRFVVRNGRCPFGPATSRSMCRFTSALAGGLAARTSGRSEVTVLESLAAGDHECRLMVDTEGGLDPVVAHRYRWPPSNAGEIPSEPGPGGRGFQVTLSLQLPRDRLSVPITRHLVRAAMDEIGVVSGDADAVELAVTEACANVINHSGPGDAYEVAVAINPYASHIRVVDVGRGFDHRALTLSGMADRDAEHGRGVALMHALVDQVRFESEPEKGTVVHLVKRLNFEQSAVAHRLMGGSGSG